MRSPRRIIATSLALVFFVVYLLNGVLILSTRTPADPERLTLWLSGGMVIYAIYHLVRCVWSKKLPDLELSRAEELWLGGGPVRRSSLAVYHIGNIVLAAMLKTSLLAVVLACDVERFELLLVGIFSSLLLLEIIRVIAQRWSSGLSDRSRNMMRVGITSIAISLGFQVVARVMETTPADSATSHYIMSGFRAIGETASCWMIQCLSAPWIASAQLVVSPNYSFAVVAKLCCSVLAIPLSIALLVRVDQWASRARHNREQKRLASGLVESAECSREDTSEHSVLATISTFGFAGLRDTATMIARQSVSVKRYRGAILFNFLAPTLLCLSPLFTGQVTEQWFYVVGGIALCTIMLAPPTLRIDFRRDIRRMMLLRSLPIKPLSMVLGQLSLPIMITLAFQWITLFIAAIVVQPGAAQVIMWTGMLSALAVFTFASENALFLAYPHHERAQGIGMMVRAKLTFLGKGSVMAVALALLVAWAVFCRSVLPQPVAFPATVAGAVIATWAIAIVSILVATWCWKRFDLSYDIPPE